MNKNSGVILDFEPQVGYPPSNANLVVIRKQKAPDVPIPAEDRSAGSYSAWTPTGSAGFCLVGFTISVVQSTAESFAPTEGWNFVTDENQIVARYDQETDSLLSRMVQAKQDRGAGGTSSEVIDEIGQSISKLRD